MSLQCFRYPPSKNSQLATAIKIACTIIPIGIALRGLLPTPLGSTVMLTTGLLAMPLGAGLRTLAGALLGCLPSCIDQCSPSHQPPINHALADRFWLNCGYRISVRY